MNLKHKLTLFVKQNALAKNISRMWPYIKPYWFRAALGVALRCPWARWTAPWLCS